jgi:hypothetical protein
MKYMDALRKYNEGSDKWCIPRKGSADYFKIRNMMKKISSIQKSKSKESSKEDIENKNRRIRILQAAIKRRLTKHAIKAKSKSKSKSATPPKPLSPYKSPMASQHKSPSAPAPKSPSSPTQPVYHSSSRAFSKDYYENQGAMKIQKFLRDKLIANKNNLNNRVNAYKLVSSRVAGIKSNDCLEKKVFNGVQGYTIRNLINLEKQIGTPSKFGAIYLTSIPDFLGIYPIASKVMTNSADNEKEVKLMTKITNEILLQKTSRHFLMIYGSCVCTKQIAEKLKLVSINELADGDLKSLIFNRDVIHDTELTFNILIQTFISIATFQNVLGYIHRDPHYGNFLFQNNNDKGYYHYIFNDVSYYLKACKYNIIIYDYGFASPIIEYKKTMLPGLINSQCRMISYDYTNIIHSFFNSSAHKIKDYPNRHPEITHKATLAIHNNLQNLLTEEYAKNNAKNGEKHFENYLFEFIIQEFLKYAPKGMFVTKRPLNVINRTPFYISATSPQATKAAKAPAKAPVKAPAKAKVHTPVPHASSTEANIVAAAKKRLAEYKKFVKEMRPKVKSNFPLLNAKQTNQKIDELYRTLVRRREGLLSIESVSIPK